MDEHREEENEFSEQEEQDQDLEQEDQEEQEEAEELFGTTLGALGPLGGVLGQVAGAEVAHGRRYCRLLRLGCGISARLHSEAASHSELAGRVQGQRSAMLSQSDAASPALELVLKDVAL